MAQWPIEISRQAFREAWILEGEDFWRSVFEMHREKMQIKKASIAINNLEKIFTATFKLVYTKGFQAMSLRDLSRASDISMGGLYAYIGSKNDLASVIEGVLRRYNEAMVGQLVETPGLTTVDRIRASIFGEIYMMELLAPWYYFCYMELRGLPKKQQEQTMELEIRLEKMFADAFKSGIAQGIFSNRSPDLLASQVIALLQQWHLKHWKFRDRKVSSEEYAQYVFETVLCNLSYQEET